MNVQEIRLDLDKRVTVSERVVIGQGDKNGTTILAHVFDHGVAYDLTGKSAIFEMRLPRRTEYVRDGNCTVSGNTITYVVDEEHVAAVHGIADCAYFDILVGANVIASTARFSVDILQSAHDGAVPAESWDAAIDQLITRGNTQMDEYDAAERERADAEELRNNSIITGADATLDISAGTPSVSVTLDSPSALGRIIHFAFNHIAGGGGDIETRTHAEATYAKITDLDGKANTTHVHAASDITSGTLPVARGGTGVTANPSMLTNLESTVADTVFEATPRPGVTGILPVANGGTGKATHTANALLTGDGTNAVKNVATADGALYATAANGAPQFGTLPIAQGGTAGTTKTKARTSLEVPVNSSIAPVESVTATANHAAGDYFMLGDVLMVATTAIATGETINTSNATTATIQGQIDTLRDSLKKSMYQGTISRIFFQNANNTVAFEFQLANGRYLSLTVYEGGIDYAYKESASDSWHYLWTSH